MHLFAADETSLNSFVNCTWQVKLLANFVFNILYFPSESKWFFNVVESVVNYVVLGRTNIAYVGIGKNIEFIMFYCVNVLINKIPVLCVQSGNSFAFKEKWRVCGLAWWLSFRPDLKGNASISNVSAAST